MSEMNSLKEMGLIDMDSVLERIGGDESFFQELLDIYVDDFVEKYVSLENAIGQSDFNTIKEIGHSLKGSSGNLSLTSLHETAYGIELAGREYDIEQAKLTFAKLHEEFKKLKESLSPGKKQDVEEKLPGMK